MAENRYKCHYYNFHLILTLHNNIPMISLYTFIVIRMITAMRIMKIPIWLFSQIFISLSFVTDNVITMKVFLDDCPCEDEVIHHFGRFLCLHHQDFAATAITLQINLWECFLQQLNWAPSHVISLKYHSSGRRKQIQCLKCRMSTSLITLVELIAYNHCKSFKSFIM
jgi:hypothetical protein